ncbi:MerR family transcriptional regulator [Metabacillus malikii]|uniref:DNA-binding transcriptional MerR regulator n=1 Tax=Metabacillus malikii TaxID=1504265 RepID=A0ABT9ZJ98_9BACI|nr:MerR family transcriptional regulator [Metabacillus malikii]MDQ0232349.1 DNA-binding transcriptional MerR regulator [Metabacillus malikii]
MEYTVKQLAQLSGVSGRTLRYYDEIGLLKPARINSSGYRIYTETEVNLLQQILFYRELDVSLEEINEIIHDPCFDETVALRNHYNQLSQKRDRLDKILATIEKTISNLQGGLHMSVNEKFEGLKEKMIKENEAKYGKEIRETYGDDKVDKSNAKLMGMTEEAYQKMTATETEIRQLLKDAVSTNCGPSSDLGHRLAEKHKDWLMFTWSDYSKEAHAGLADMYVADERFSNYYDKEVEGGAKFLRDAIHSYVGK